MSIIDKFLESIGLGRKKIEPTPPTPPDGPKKNGGFNMPQYEIILIRPQSMDDMDYVVDQVSEESNPVIVDLGYFEEEGLDAVQMAVEKINILRQKHGAESILLCNCSNKNMVIVAPPRVNILKKE